MTEMPSINIDGNVEDENRMIRGLRFGGCPMCGGLDGFAWWDGWQGVCHEHLTSWPMPPDEEEEDRYARGHKEIVPINYDPEGWDEEVPVPIPKWLK